MKVAVLYCGTSHLKPLMDRCIFSGVSPVVMESNTSLKSIASLGGVGGIIISGSSSSVLEFNCPTVDPEIYHCGIPVLGICYGMQRMAKDLGGDVVRFPAQEKGFVLMKLGEPSVLYSGFTEKGVDVWMSHSCQVRTPPPGFIKTGETKGTFFASFEREHLFGVQFHPEQVNSGSGKQIVQNFFYGVCKPWLESR